MKKSVIVLILMLFVVVNANANEWTGNLNFFLGQKTLDKDDWAPVEDHGEFGILLDFKPKSWPISIAIDILGSASEETLAGVVYKGTTSEFDVGVRKIWETGGPIRPFIGGGIASIAAEFEVSNGYFLLSDDDTSTGIWINGGVYWTLGKHFNLGLEARYSKAEVKLFGVDGEAGGSHVGLLLGYHW